MLARKLKSPAKGGVLPPTLTDSFSVGVNNQFGFSQSVNLGDPSPDRLIVFAVSNRGERSDIFFGDDMRASICEDTQFNGCVSATRVVSITDFESQSLIFAAPFPVGASGVIRLSNVLFSDNLDGGGGLCVSIVALYGFSATPKATATDTDNSTVSFDFTGNVDSGDVVLAAASQPQFEVPSGFTSDVSSSNLVIDEKLVLEEQELATGHAIFPSATSFSMTSWILDGETIKGAAAVFTPA